MEILKKAIFSIVHDTKQYSSGWIAFNCPMCTYFGEPTRDKNKRGAILFSLNGEVYYKCFRCNYRAHWQPGYHLNQKFKFFLAKLGKTKEEIQNIEFQIWKENQKNFKKIESQVKNKAKNIKKEIPFDFKEISLPESFKNIIDYYETQKFNKNYIDCVNYLINKRGKFIFNYYQFYWSPKYKDCILIPFFFKNKIVGYALNYFNSKKHKYIVVEKPANFIFQIENLFKDRKYVILVEGIFDAIAIDGVGILGNNLNESQIEIINSSNKKIILLPDRDNASKKLIDIGIKNNWLISIPGREDFPIDSNFKNNKFINSLWKKEIKDASDAVKNFGRLYTVKTIIDSATDDYFKIKLFEKFILR